MAGSIVSDKNIPVKYDWYQTETHVVITILIKNIQNEDLKIDFNENSVNLIIKQRQQQEHELNEDELKINYNLSHKIQPNECSYKLTPLKIEIKLKKTEGVRWTKLIGVEEQQLKTIPQQQNNQQINSALIYPTSSRTGYKNWSAIEKRIEQDEANETPAGEEAINKLLREVYGKGSDEVKRAMNKSYTESGGTVLSTNWNEIGRGKVEVKPPDGVEFKKW